MISARASALLHAAATIYAGSFVAPAPGWDGEMRDGYFQMGPTDALEKAYDFLSRIEAREKAQLTPRETARV